MSVTFFASADRPHRIDGILHNFAQIGGRKLDRQFARENPAHIEQIFDQPSLRAGVALDGFDGAIQMRSAHRRVVQKLRPPEDRSHRRSQLVRKRRQELVLDEIRAQKIAARLRVRRRGRLRAVLDLLLRFDVGAASEPADILARFVAHGRRAAEKPAIGSVGIATSSGIRLRTVARS